MTGTTRTPVLTGAEQLRLEGFARLRGRRVGLLTNPTGVTVDLVPLVDRLAAAPGVTLAALFGPEHGLLASAAEGEDVGGGRHPRLGIPIHSLYGARRAPSETSLAGLDLLIVDIQDAGVRFFTYTSTVALVLEVCGRIGLPVLLLDRPNPLGGTIVEGPLVEPGLRSFVGHLPVPIRYGLTIGELACFANATEGYGATLEVLPLRGWRRAMRYADTGLPWVLPSPNLPTLATVNVYPGTCLFEGPTVSEGRGTTLPFEVIGAPWLDGERLATGLNALELPGLRWRPVAFTPRHGRIHVDTACFGVQLHPTDLDTLRPVTAALHLLAAIRAQDPTAFGWRAPWGDGPQRPIDLLAGTGAVREAIDTGASPAELLSGWDEELARFQAATAPYRLYG
jgi:uncharacterized protein YbbC (DUF1343 family)